MHFLHTRQWGKMDYRVSVTFLILAVACLALLSYKVAVYTPCPDFQIEAGGKLQHQPADSHTFYINEQITFTSSFPGKQTTLYWDLDDGSPVKGGKSITHYYEKEGYYLVKVQTSGGCIQTLNIRVTQTKTAVSAPVGAVSPIVSADVLYVGDEAAFNTTAVGANYEWRVEELPQIPTQGSNSARFIFTQAGNYTIVLKVDNEKIFKKMIQVQDQSASLNQAPALPPVTPSDIPPLPTAPLPLPQKEPLGEANQQQQPAPVAEPEQPAAPPQKVYEQLPEPAIKAMLDGVIGGTKTLDDFKNILCNGAGTKVMANDQSTTFAALCNELQEKRGLPLLKKKRKIESFKVVRDESNGNCVKIIYVKYK